MSYDVFNGVYNMKYIDAAYATNGIMGILRLYNECNYYQCFVLYHCNNITYDEFYTFLLEGAKDEKASLIMENMIGSALGLFDAEETDNIHDNAQVIIEIFSEIAEREGPELLNIVDLYKNKLYIMHMAERYRQAFSNDVMGYMVNITTACDYIDIIKDKPFLSEMGDIETILNTMLDDWEMLITQGCIFEGNENYIDRVKDELNSTFMQIHNAIVRYYEDNSDNSKETMDALLEMVKRRIVAVIMNTFFNTSPIIFARACMDFELHIPNLRVVCQHSIEFYSINWMSEIISEVITEICTIDSKMYETHFNRCRVEDFMSLVDDIRSSEFSYCGMAQLAAMLEAYASRTERADALLDNPSTLDNYLAIYYVVKDRILFVDTGDYENYRELSTGNEDDFTNELNALDDIMEWLV